MYCNRANYKLMQQKHAVDISWKSIVELTFLEYVMRSMKSHLKLAKLIL